MSGLAFVEFRNGFPDGDTIWIRLDAIVGFQSGLLYTTASDEAFTVAEDAAEILAKMERAGEALIGPYS